MKAGPTSGAGGQRRKGEAYSRDAYGNMEISVRSHSEWSPIYMVSEKGQRTISSSLKGKLFTNRDEAQSAIKQSVKDNAVRQIDKQYFKDKQQAGLNKIKALDKTVNKCRELESKKSVKGLL